MHLDELQSYFGDHAPLIHTVSGFVMVASLLVAAILMVTRRRPSVARAPVPPVAAKQKRSESSKPMREAARAPVEPDQPPSIDQKLSVASGFEDEEPTFVGKVRALPALHYADREEDERDAEDPYVTPQVMLVCLGDSDSDEATFPQARILLTASGATDRGKKRSRNEDSYLMLHEHSVFAVADGMGGYNGGEVASSLAVEAIREAFERMSFDGDLESKRPIPRRGRELACSLLEANRAVLAASRTSPELAQMGTTLVAARFSPDKQRVYVGNVGDSRCYRLRGNDLEQLTTDHTMRLLGLHGLRGNELYRAIGVKQSVDIDLIVDVPQAEDTYLLCSDGLPKMASVEEIQALLVSEPDLDMAAQRLIDLANAAGGRDNVTVVLIRVKERAGFAAAPVKSSKVGSQSLLGTPDIEAHAGAARSE